MQHLDEFSDEDLVEDTARHVAARGISSDDERNQTSRVGERTLTVGNAPSINASSPAARISKVALDFEDDGKDIKAMMKELVKEVESENSANMAVQSTISKTPPQMASAKQLETAGKLASFEIGA